MSPHSIVELESVKRASTAVRDCPAKESLFVGFQGMAFANIFDVALAVNDFHIYRLAIGSPDGELGLVFANESRAKNRARRPSAWEGFINR